MGCYDVEYKGGFFIGFLPFFLHFFRVFHLFTRFFLRCQVAAWREYHWLECYMYGCLKDTANDRLALRLLLKSARHGIPILGIKNPVILHSTYPTEKINQRFQKADSKIQTDSNPDSKPDSKTDSKSSIKYTPNPNFELDSLYLTQYLDNTPNPKVTAHPSARRLAALVAQAITCYCKNSGHAGDMINDYKLTREDFIFESCGIEEIHDFQNYKKTAFTVDRMKQITTRFDKNSALQVQLYEIFVKLLDMVHKNAVTISRNRVNHDKGQVDEDERHQIGLALYPRVSFLNHSCKPNAFLAFGNLGNVQVKITERIQSGDSINISYGPTAFRSNTRVRKEFLFQNYCFPCGCVACSPNSKLRKEFDDLLKKTVALKCEACLGFLGDKSQGLHVDGFYRCEHCDEKFLLKEKEVKVKEAKFLFEKAKINPGQRLECLEKSLGIAESVYFEMNEILIEIRDKLAHELARNTLFEKAAKYRALRFKWACVCVTHRHNHYFQRFLTSKKTTSEYAPDTEKIQSKPQTN